METIILVLLMGGMNLLAFLVGARTAQKADRGEEIELPTLNPMQTYKEHREQSEANKEQERLNTMMENINNYDGTGAGQKDII
jgi:hypothetical protein